VNERLVPSPTMPSRPRVAFAIEQTLGHLTHSDNLRRLLADSPTIELVAVPIPGDAFGALTKVPVLSNWTFRLSGKARQLIGRLQRHDPVDAVFAHTQVIAVLLGRWMKLIPTIVSLDATPEQYDTLGEFYAHEVGPAPVERFKRWLNVRALRRAEHVVTWSVWAGDGVVARYGVPAQKVTVIPPGVDVERWERTSRCAADGTVRILFVGGDLARKGGDVLLRAVADLRAEAALPPIELHLVTRSDVAEHDGVHVHRLGPNSPELIELYHSSDIFCLPTLGDCLPMVLPEAGAAELALVSTDVGAIHEIVRDGETGLLVPPGDQAALTAALRTLVADADLRARLGRAAGHLVRTDHDAATNANRLAELLADVSRRRPARRPLLARRR
jgi:glycosyltransferase involved in cell wall biosynthesis